MLAFGAPAEADPGTCVPADAWTEVVVVTPTVAATPDSFTEWANKGDQIRTEEKVAPDTDTDTVRYVYVGETEPEVITPAVEGGHYSWNGGNVTISQPPTVVPDDLDPENPWQRNTDTEPAGHYNGATWLNDALHYTGNSDANASFFYLVAAKPEVTDVDYLWQQQTRAFVPGTPEVPAVTKTVEHPAVVCPTPTPTTPTVQPPEVLPSSGTATPEPTEDATAQPPEEEQQEPQAEESEEPEVLPAEASKPPKAQQVPTVIAAGYAGWTDAELWGAALVSGGLALLVSSGTVLMVTRRE